MALKPAARIGSRLLGIGTDIVYLPRFVQLLQKHPLAVGSNQSSFIKIARKFMHPYEIAKMQALAAEHADNMPTVTYIAGIWAIKEAVLKAFSSFVPTSEMPTAQSIYTRLTYRDRKDSGQPLLQFDEQFPVTATSPSEVNFYYRYVKNQRTQTLVSISHDKEYLVSFVSLVSEEDEIKKSSNGLFKAHGN